MSIRNTYIALVYAIFLTSPSFVATTHASILSPIVTDRVLINQSDDVVLARAAVRRGGAVVGPRGGAAVRRGAAVVGPRGAAYRSRTAVVGPRGNVAVRNTTVVRPGGWGGGVRWARPGYYTWPVGGAIAAGAAIGFATAATAAVWAGTAPAPGMCWYYTDPSKTQGFWDYCPR